jgi:hypothetical protein
MLLSLSVSLALLTASQVPDSSIASDIRRELPAALLFIQFRPEPESRLSVIVKPHGMQTGSGAFGGIAAEHRLYLGFLLQVAPTPNITASLSDRSPAVDREHAYLAALAKDSLWLRAIVPTVARYRATHNGDRAQQHEPVSVLRRVRWSQVLEVASRFLYPYVSGTERLDIKGQVCGTNNGLASLTRRDVEVEAFAYSALFPEKDDTPLLAEFGRVLAEEVARGRQSAIPTSLSGIQSAVWTRMAASSLLRMVLEREATRMRAILPFTITLDDLRRSSPS